MLGGTASDVTNCNFYCSFFDAVRAELLSACGDDEDCREGAPPTFMHLQPAPGFFCADQARYALFSSCIVPADQQQTFSDAVDDLLAAVSADSSCVVPAVSSPPSSHPRPPSTWRP